MKLTSLALLWFVLTAAALAQDDVDYLRQVKPMLQARCFACHGALKQEGGLRLDTAALAAKGGDSGSSFKAGDTTASLLIKRVSTTDEAERMPPEGEPLTKAQIAVLNQWIQQGAKAPADEQPERDPRDHWSFQRPMRPAVPMVQNSKWIKNFIDAFVLAKLEAAGIKPQQPADRRTLLRRVTLDLTGLPPSVEQQEAFLADQSPDAYEKVVDRLLASQQYGARWGRHFMDIWRYSDWWGLGAEVRNSQKHIWHWRDWIIDSLNADKGYDQMIREMLAADELYPNDLARLRGSGFLARQYFKFNRTTWLDETVEHTSKAFLGLTFNCGKCHDHKYDPLSQVEYYRLRAFFEPYQVRTDLVPGETSFEKNGIPRAFDCNLDAVTQLHIRGDDRNPDKSRVIEPAVPAFLARADFKIEPVTLPIEAHQPGLREFVLQTLLADAEKSIAEAKRNLEKARQDLAKAEATKSVSVPAVKKPYSNEASSAANTGAIIAQDTFASPQPELWQTVGGEWKHENGRLIQSHDGASRRSLRLKKTVPDNFAAKLKFATTGGQMWKSVGIAFDIVGDQSEKLVYLSAYASGPKLQVSYRKDGGASAYPQDGMVAREVKLKTPYELGIQVRGSLVNVAIDGQHALAYRLPVNRQSGGLDLVTFDATVEFRAFELAELPSSTTLVEPLGSKPKEPVTSFEIASAAVLSAEKTLAAAELEPVSIKARAAADRAKFVTPLPSNASELAQEAARAEKAAVLAQAAAELARAELAVAQTPDAKKAELDKKRAAAKTALDAATKSAASPGESYSSLRGSLKTLESNLESEASRMKPFPTTSTGRRTALAQWIASNQNPLTARVIVNHVWGRHVGRPLVATVFDFGRKGATPTHPELLDWLAVELMEQQWSLKKLHRLIVTSQVYRQSSSNDETANERGDESITKSSTSTLVRSSSQVSNVERDPDNKLLWRMNPLRMESQIVRDSLLALSGELDLTLGGPSVAANDENSKRRSLYFTHSNNDQNRFLAMFDDAKVQECYRRAESVVPQQALALENSRLASQAAERIATKLVASDSKISDSDFIQRAFVTVLSAEPTSAEREACMSALKEWSQLIQPASEATTKSRVRLIQALLNHNDFVTVR